MSTITQNWNEDIIRYIIKNIDKKTGLNGAELSIELVNNNSYYGRYSGENRKFLFNVKLFNNPSTKESEVIDTIRHEYAHFYTHVCNLKHYIGFARNEIHHGRDWKWACRMVGARPRAYCTPENYAYWTIQQAKAAYEADDIIAFKILDFINKWDQVPVDDDIAARMRANIKARYPDSYFEAGDKVLHAEQGYGTVIEAIPFRYWSQKIEVRFEDNTSGIYTAKEISKIVNGKAVIFEGSRKRNAAKSTGPEQLTLEDLYPSIFNTP